MRNKETFDEIVENCLNGNWTDAAKLCVEYGFYANDLIIFQEQCEKGIEGFNDLTDIAVLVEVASKLRYRQ